MAPLPSLPTLLPWLTPPCGTTKFHSKSVTPLQNNNHLLELPSTFVYVVKLNIQELLQSSIISATSQVIFSKLHNITLNANIMQLPACENKLPCGMATTRWLQLMPQVYPGPTVRKQSDYSALQVSDNQCLQPWLGAFSIFLPFFSIFMAISVFLIFLTGVTSNSRRWSNCVSKKTFFLSFFFTYQV